MFEYTESSIGMQVKTWTIIDIAWLPDRSKGRAFLCQCQCGAKKHIRRCEMVLGKRLRCRSCGSVDVVRMRVRGVWNQMHKRCKDVNNQHWSLYGGRGISVDPLWDKFQAFYDWSLASGYSCGLEIDRIDNNSHYSPSNCRWVTRKQNCNNTRRNVLITAFGETKTATQWEDDIRCTVSAHCLRRRITSRRYASAEDAMTSPSQRELSSV